MAAVSVEQSTGIVGVLVVDALAMCACAVVWTFIAAIVLTPMGAVPPLFLVFAIPILLGPGATFATLAPRWGRVRLVRFVIPPLIAAIAYAAAVSPVISWLIGDPPGAERYAVCTIVGFVVFAAGIAAARYAPD
jgi:hypothetical protein